MSNTTTTETFPSEETDMASSSPVSFPTSPSSSTTTAPTALVEDAPVSSPVSVPTASAPTSPVSKPISSPTRGASFPSLSPEPVPTAPIYDEDMPVFPPASLPTRLTPPPPASTLEEVEAFLFNPFHFILIVAVTAAVTLFILWKGCKSWKLRREKQMLRLQSTRVDAVLGDMQMVGMDDYDGDDPELI